MSRRPPPTIAIASSRLAGLEGLRGVAALSVMLLHLPAIFRGLPAPFAKGYLGVDLFFMLSGFVMARGFEARMAAGLNVPHFIWGRYTRMWPIMAVGGLIGLPLLWLRVGSPLQFAGIATANMLLLPVSFQRETFPLNVPAWTIFFILLGNLLHVAGLYRLQGRGLLLAIAASLVAAIAAATHAGSLDVGARPENFLLGLPRLLLSYLIGMALSRYWTEQPSIPVPALLGLGGMPLLILLAWALGFNGWVFDILFVIIACPLLIAGSMRLQNGERLAAFAGAWSFPLYAVHFPLLIWMRWFGFGWLAAACAVLAISILLTLAEQHLRRSHR